MSLSAGYKKYEKVDFSICDLTKHGRLDLGKTSYTSKVVEVLK